MKISPMRRAVIATAPGWVALLAVVTVALLGKGSAGALKATATPLAATATLKVSATSLPASATPEPATQTRVPTDTEVGATNTALPATETATLAFGATATPAATFTPWPAASLCPDHGELHDNSRFHTLWDATRGCHYDHEHGTNPFTPEVSGVFAPLGDMRTLLCGVEIGSCNPSSGAENTIKHTGHKWDVQVPVIHPCATGFEGAAVGIDAIAMEYHAFGDPQIEYESRNHSSSVFVRQCGPDGPGYIMTSQLQEFGQRVFPYQGELLDYPDNFQPTYGPGFGPYMTTDCVGAGPGCRVSIQDIVARLLGVVQKWTSKPTGTGPRPETSILFRFLFDVRDAFKILDWASVGDGYPFKYLWVCTTDNGETFAQAGCRYNNSAIMVHEVAGDVPAAWDNLDGFDTDPRLGRVSFTGFVSRFGMPVAPGACSIPGMGCNVVKMVNAYVGRWGADLCPEKCSFITPANTPDRGDIYFCGEQVCAETDAGARPSGWLGPEN